ncbi:PREDICTED: uncharacterized protein LOC106128255 isoform X1 [Papilio xuthus]|uniref:Uncharacterized protein LOC106128255 isoform X1 n=1 Tax=Papilio xuthus TaxID=66420 RepID=A0AAJ7EL88_PAPXU|nr:PREDICTED: uncharacterized protein LOC106128255 isoform X1 [Papilio xuthus]
MSIVYFYFKFFIVSGVQKGVLVCSTGGANAALTVLPPVAAHWEDMGKSSKAQAKEPEAVISDVATQRSIPGGDGGLGGHGEGLGKMYKPQFRMLKKSPCCDICFRILFLAVGFLTVLQSIAVIVVSVTSALAIKIYSDDLSGRLVAIVVMLVTAAIAISFVIYGSIGAVRKQRRPVQSAISVLVVVAVIQAVILSVSLIVTTEDEVKLGRFLSDSFKLARDDNPRHVKIWARTQHDLNCCGVYSAEDYRAPNFPTYFAANVPISCCPSYDPDRSELVQERERESCKAKKEYYDIGCRNLIINVFKETLQTLLVVSIFEILLEIILIIVGVILARKDKEQLTDRNDVPPIDEVITTDKKGKSKP